MSSESHSLRAYLAGLAEAMPPGTERDHWVERVTGALDAIDVAHEALAGAASKGESDEQH